MEKPEWVPSTQIEKEPQWLESDSSVPVLDGIPFHEWSGMSPEWRQEHGLPPTSNYRTSIEEDLARKAKWEAERFRPPTWRRQAWRDQE